MSRNYLFFFCFLTQIVYASDIHFKVGMSVSSDGAPEVDLSDPLGIIRMEYNLIKDKNGGIDLFCEHVSSVSSDEKGYGLNHCGIMLEL